jgi:hypothetical protein
MNATGNATFITKRAGVDVFPDGWISLASALPGDPTLAMHCSAGKTGFLLTHYAWRYAKVHIDRVTADSGTNASEGHIGQVLYGLRGFYDGASLVVPCASGKASVLYAVDARQDVGAPAVPDAVTDDFVGVSDYSVTAVPDLVAERDLFDDTLIGLTVTNTGGPEVRYWRADEVMGNFVFLSDVGPASDYLNVDDPVDGDTNYKYKAAFISSGTRNGSPREVVGQRSASVYVIADSSTL